VNTTELIVSIESVITDLNIDYKVFPRLSAETPNIILSVDVLNNVQKKELEKKLIAKIDEEYPEGSVQVIFDDEDEGEDDEQTQSDSEFEWWPYATFISIALLIMTVIVCSVLLVRSRRKMEKQITSIASMNDGEEEKVEVVQVPQQSPVETGTEEKSIKNKFEENESSGEDLFVVTKETNGNTVDENTKRDDSDVEELYQKVKTKGNTKTEEGP